MPNHRTPSGKAKLTGADKNHPERFRDRNEPDGGPPIGDPPDCLSGEALKAWERFRAELPWLVESDRAILTSACLLRGVIDADAAKVTVSHFREYRQTLGCLGATPTSRSHVDQEGEDDDDPFAQFVI